VFPEPFCAGPADTATRRLVMERKSKKTKKGAKGTKTGREKFRKEISVKK
jgi:hypothetical protein